jgi:hypothetical protein
MKHTIWYFHVPGTWPAQSMELEKPGTEREAGAAIRAWLGVKRLPNGTEVWPKT